MAKTRGAHSFRPRVRQGPTPPAASPFPVVIGPSPTAVGFPAVDPVAVGPSVAAAGAGPRVPAAFPTIHATPPAPAVGDVMGSSSMAPAQRRYHTRVGPTPPALSHPRPARRAPRPRGPGLQAQGSHLHRDPERPPLDLIRVFSEPQTCLRGPSSGDLTSPATPSRGMLAARREIFMGRCTMISRHLLRTRDSMVIIQRYHLEPFMVPR